MTVDPTRIDITTDPLTQRMRGVAIHGDTPFDVPYISHIEGNLYMGGCQDHLVLPEYIKHLVSLYPWEAYVVPHELASALEVRLYDAEPDETLLDGLATWASACVDDGSTLIHCQAGLNRSGLIAAMVLVRRGRTVKEAIALLRERRSPAVLCNPYFRQWLAERED